MNVIPLEVCYPHPRKIVERHQVTMSIFRHSTFYFVAIITIFALSGCPSTPEEVDPVTTPTIDSFDTRTNESNLPITGTRSPNNIIWVQYKTQGSAIELAASGIRTNWSGELELQEGMNQFVLFASNEFGKDFSPTTEEFEIILDTVAPTCPQVNAYPNSVNLLGEDSTKLTLSGTKASDGNLLINSSVAVGHDGNETWEKEITLQMGDNAFEIRSDDDLGNSAGTTECSNLDIMHIVGVDLEAPTFSAETPTASNNVTLSIAGTKPAGARLFLAHNTDAEQAVELNVSLEADIWNYASIQWEEGENTLHLVAQLPDLEAISPITSTTILIDTTAPGPVTLNSVPAVVDNNNLTITGTKDAGSRACYYAGSQHVCEEGDIATDSTTFSFDIVLFDGFNGFYFHTSDELDNFSPNVYREVIKLNPPQVTILMPSPAQVVTEASISASVSISHQNFPEAEMAEVLFCINETCTDVVASQTANGEYSGTLALTGVQAGETFEFSCQATDASGYSTTKNLSLIFYSSLVGISPKNETAQNPSAAMSPDGVIHTAWTVGSSVFHRSFNPTQNGWGDIQLVSDILDAQEPSVAVDTAGKGHVFWVSQGPGDTSTNIFRRIVEADGTLRGIEQVTDNSSPEISPDSSGAPDGSVHVVWTREHTSDPSEIYFSKSVNDILGTPLAYCANTTGITCTEAKIDTDSQSRSHVVWRGTGGPDGSINKEGGFIYYRRRQDAGFTDNQWIEVSTNSTLCIGCTPKSHQPNIFVDSNDIATVIWADNAPTASLASCPSSSNENAASTDFDIYLRRYSGNSSIDANFGNTVKYQGPDTCASDEDSSHPEVSALDNGELIVTWIDTDTNGKSVLKRVTQTNSSDGFLEFSPMENFLEQDAESQSLEILRRPPNEFHFFWLEKSVGDGSFPTLFFQDGDLSPVGDSHVLHSTEKLD